MNKKATPLFITIIAFTLIIFGHLLTRTSEAQTTSIVSALNDALNENVWETSGLGIQLVGTCTTGVVTFEATIDNVTWAAIEVKPLASSTLVSTSAVAGAWVVNTGGLYRFRARVSDACDGNNFTVTFRTSKGVSE